MLTCKLKDRCPSAVPIGICKIKKHSLKFHKVSHAISKKNRIRDISGKGDIVPSETDEVYGVLFSIDKSEKRSLDKAEGYPKYGYDKKTIDVVTIKGEKYKSVMYFAKKSAINPKKKPYHWYKEQVVQGAKEHGLPEDYIKKIKAVESIPDQDREREKIQSKHLS